MRNSRVRKSFEGSQNQADLPLAPVPDNLAAPIRVALSAALRRSRKKVDQVAFEMALMLGQPVSPHILYSMLSESHAQHRFPLEWAAAFCRVTGDTGVLRVVLEALGLPMPQPGDGELLRLAKVKLQAELFSREAAGIEAQMLRRNLEWRTR